MTSIRVLLADDQELILAALRGLVERIEGVRVVAEALDGRSAVALAAEHGPDVAILDISMQELNGIEAAARIRAVSPSTRILILSAHATEEFVSRSIRAGASGYLTKDSAPQELALAVGALMKGEFYFSSRVSRHLVAGLLEASEGAIHDPLAPLTSRQREVLQMIAEGKSTKEIAYRLGVSGKTVHSHRSAIMERLGIHDVAGLALFAARHGLLT
ncbi:MAG: response regulator [Usitatibacter sp.]